MQKPHTAAQYPKGTTAAPIGSEWRIDYLKHILKGHYE